MQLLFSFRIAVVSRIDIIKIVLKHCVKTEYIRNTTTRKPKNCRL